MFLRTVLLTYLLTTTVLVFAKDEFNAGNLDFTLKFFKHFYNASTNSIVSPASIRLLLATIHQSAGPELAPLIAKAVSLPPTDKNQTAEDARRFLHSINNDQLRVLFKIFKVDDPLEETFERAAATIFDSDFETVDFLDKSAVLSAVNGWVSRATNHMIDSFIEEDSVDPTTELMLVNAVTLKAHWASSFPRGRTKKLTFHFMNGDHEVEMMSQTLSVPYKTTDDFHAAELRYSEDSDLSMWIILPRGRGSMGELVRALSTETIQNIRLGCKTMSLNVELPRFSIKNEFDVHRVFEKMGYGELFGHSDVQVFPGRKSEFGDFFQSAAIQIDEQGTIATAASRVNLLRRMGSRPFFAHKPFIFFIQKRSTNAILFIGQYSNYEV